MKKFISSLCLPFFLLCIHGIAYGENSQSTLLTAKQSVIKCVHQAYPLIKQVDKDNPCQSGTDCFYAWQMEQHCGAILTKYFPNCFIAVSTNTSVKCLAKGQIVNRDKENWDPNNKFKADYTLIDYKLLD